MHKENIGRNAIACMRGDRESYCFFSKRQLSYFFAQCHAKIAFALLVRLLDGTPTINCYSGKAAHFTTYMYLE